MMWDILSVFIFQFLIIQFVMKKYFCIHWLLNKINKYYKWININYYLYVKLFYDLFSVYNVSVFIFSAPLSCIISASEVINVTITPFMSRAGKYTSLKVFFFFFFSKLDVWKPVIYINLMFVIICSILDCIAPSQLN